jgi:hypothetical protein
VTLDYPYLPGHISYDKSYKYTDPPFLENIKGRRLNTRAHDNIQMELNEMKVEQQGLNVHDSGE